MLEFKPMGLGDIPLLRPYLYTSGFRTCDYTVGGMLMWRDYFQMEYAVNDGVLYTRLRAEDGRIFYNLPLGAPLSVALPHLRATATDGIRFCTLPAEGVAALEALRLPLRVTARREFYDYLYTADSLAGLMGRVYAGQRNLCRQFERDNPIWEYRPLDGAVLSDVCAFLAADTTARADAYGREEAAKVHEVTRHFAEYGFFGAALYTPEGLCGFSIGERVGDTLYVHIERAARGKKGAYQMLVREFSALAAGQGAVYINREEDMGNEGLRTAKLAYHPTCLLEKFEVEVME